MDWSGDRGRNFCDSIEIWKSQILMRIKNSTICGRSWPPGVEISAIRSKIENFKFCWESRIRPNQGPHGVQSSKFLRSGGHERPAYCRILDSHQNLRFSNFDRIAEISAAIAPSAHMGVAHTKLWESWKKWKSRFSEIIYVLPPEKMFFLKYASLAWQFNTEKA